MAKYLVTGVADVDKALQEFLPKVANKMYKQSLRKAGKTVQAAARANLARVKKSGGDKKRKQGALSAGIKVRAFRSVHRTGLFKTLGSGQQVAIKRADIGIQISTTEGKYKDKDFAGAQIELGRPKTKPYEERPFLRPAIYDNETRIRAFIIDDIRQQINATKANNIK